MASSPLLSFRPPLFRASQAAEKGCKAPPPQAAKAGGSTWWSPIFGWSTEPDYIDGGADLEAKDAAAATVDQGRAAAGGRSRGVVFTEEKARRLRMKTVETSSFHDAMYHSAIASRLASDFQGRSNEA